MVLLSSEGMSRGDIAERVGVQPHVVTKWRKRFCSEGTDGLFDRRRTGRPPEYGLDVETRVLQVLERDPPSGFGRWNGPMIAAELGDVSVHQVWRIMRRHKVQLERRRSWCISTDPEFTSKAADIVGLYLSPPEGAVVFCVDEKPCIQALERAQGWLRLPNGKAVTGFSHEYKRHGTTTLFAALDVMTGIVKTAHRKRRKRRQFLDFMNQLVRDIEPETEVHVVLDNLNTHKPKHDRWLARHKNVTFHYTPTHASWMNMVEIWFSILQKKSLEGASFTSVSQVRRHIDAFAEAYNENAQPFEWRKATVKQRRLGEVYSQLRN
jgi:transposase